MPQFFRKIQISTNSVLAGSVCHLRICGPVSPDHRLNRKRGNQFLAMIACIIVGLLAGDGWGQGVQNVVTMKSGLQFEGEVRTVPEISEGAGIASPFANQLSIVRIDDGLRRVFVSFHRIRAPIGESSRNEIEIPVSQRTYPGSSGTGSVVSIGPFDLNGHRPITIQTGGVSTPLSFMQGITKISPRYCELQTLVGNKDAGRLKQWEMMVGTSTIPAEVLRSVLRKRIIDDKNPAEYLTIAEFFLQAKRFNLATEELVAVQRRFPDLRERIRDDRLAIRESYAQHVLREIQTRMDAGQPRLATEFAKKFRKEGIAGETRAQFFDLENRLENTEQQLDEKRQKLNELIADFQTADATHLTAAKRFQQELETELNAVNAPRLDAYLNQANIAAMPVENKLSLAISGWLLGTNAATVTENLAITADLYSVRDLVTEYLQTDDALRRSRILNEIDRFECGNIEYIAPMLQQMLPVHAPDLSQHTGQTPIEFFVEIPGRKINPEPMRFRCLVHLPPEYNAYRKYPLLVTLPGGRQTAEQNLRMWCGAFNPKLSQIVAPKSGVLTGHAMRNGYIVVAVDWRLPGQGSFNFSAREHATVLKAMRTAMRMFQIDSDRVFLSGHGIGGDAAYDIGISHPEHWAGVIGISGKMDKYIEIYEDNRHINLPLYSVVGSEDYPAIGENKKSWNQWLKSKKYLDCTVVMYKGRANDLLPEEIPEVLKWANAQRRRVPDKRGFSFECKSVRPWDNYFWFLEFHGIPEDAVVWPQDYIPKAVRMKISGETKADNPNEFRIGPASPSITNNATLWLSPEFVDFEEEIEIKGRGKSFRDIVVPSTEVLLEDVRRRADRQHPFWARIDCVDLIWQAK
jgi:pimeloyl-ACP methyl ester carboxylesterase